MFKRKTKINGKSKTSPKEKSGFALGKLMAIGRSKSKNKEASSGFSQPGSAPQFQTPGGMNNAPMHLDPPGGGGGGFSFQPPGGGGFSKPQGNYQFQAPNTAPPVNGSGYKPPPSKVDNSSLFSSGNQKSMFNKPSPAPVPGGFGKSNKNNNGNSRFKPSKFVNGSGFNPPNSGSNGFSKPNNGFQTPGSNFSKPSNNTGFQSSNKGFQKPGTGFGNPAPPVNGSGFKPPGATLNNAPINNGGGFNFNKPSTQTGFSFNKPSPSGNSGFKGYEVNNSPPVNGSGYKPPPATLNNKPLNSNTGGGFNFNKPATQTGFGFNKPSNDNNSSFANKQGSQNQWKTRRRQKNKSTIGRGTNVSETTNTYKKNALEKSYTGRRTNLSNASGQNDLKPINTGFKPKWKSTKDAGNTTGGGTWQNKRKTKNTQKKFQEDPFAESGDEDGFEPPQTPESNTYVKPSFGFQKPKTTTAKPPTTEFGNKRGTNNSFQPPSKPFEVKRKTNSFQPPSKPFEVKRKTNNSFQPPSKPFAEKRKTNSAFGSSKKAFEVKRKTNIGSNAVSKPFVPKKKSENKGFGFGGSGKNNFQKPNTTAPVSQFKFQKPATTPPNNGFTAPKTNFGSEKKNSFNSKPNPTPPNSGFSRPNPAPPSSGFNPPNAGFKPPNSGFNQPSSGFNQPSSGFKPPSSGFKQPSSGFNQPSSGFNQPSSGFNQPSSGFKPPSSGFNQPKTGFNARPTPTAPTTGFNTKPKATAPAPSFNSKPPASFNRSNKKKSNNAGFGNIAAIAQAVANKNQNPGGPKALQPKEIEEKPIPPALPGMGAVLQGIKAKGQPKGTKVVASKGGGKTTAKVTKKAPPKKPKRKTNIQAQKPKRKTNIQAQPMKSSLPPLPGNKPTSPDHKSLPPVPGFQPKSRPAPPGLGNQPNNGFGAPNSGFQAPNSGFGQPSSGFQAPNSGFQAPNSGFQPPKPKFQQVNTGFQEVKTKPPGMNFSQPGSNNFVATRGGSKPPGLRISANLNNEAELATEYKEFKKFRMSFNPFKKKNKPKAAPKPPPTAPVNKPAPPKPPVNPMLKKAMNETQKKHLRESIKGLQGLASFWDNFGKTNKKKQEMNPFSENFAGKREIAQGNIFNSKSEERAKKAQEWTNREIDRVCQVIKDFGTFDQSKNATMITFGELFVIYEKISDTLVFMLIKARKRGKITYDAGEMLLQGRDDAVQIYAFH